MISCGYFLAPFISKEVFAILLGVLIAAFSIQYLKHLRKYLANYQLTDTAFILILLGGAGNTYQRFQTGCVSDPIAFFDIVHFNLYDLAVTLGIILLLVAIWRNKHN